MATSISAAALRAAPTLFAALVWMAQSAAGVEPQSPPPTILSTALVVARNQGVPHMTSEENLTWQGSELRSLTQLLARAGKFDEALALIDGLDTPDRVKVEAFVPIVEAALRMHDEVRARAVTKRIESFSEWTVPVALGELVVARHKAGDEAEALRLAREIDEPGARAEAYLALGRYDDMLRAAQKIAPEMMHIASSRGPFWEDQYGARQTVLVRLVTAFVDRGDPGDLGRARAAMKALDSVPDRSANQFRARALLELARKDRVVENLKAAEQAVGEGAVGRLGDLLGAADLFSQVAYRFAAAGEPASAAGVVQRPLPC